jgi:hypothetical protein
VVAAGDVLADRPSGHVLHRGALGGGLLAQRLLLVVVEAEGHRHAAMASV